MADDQSFDEEELRQAIALSLMDSSVPGTQENRVDVAVGHSSKGNTMATASSPGGLVGLDRRAMEQERLARLQRKRKADAADVSPPPLSRDDRASSALKQTKTSDSTIHTFSGGISPNGKARLAFADGVVKKTWCFGMPREGDDIKIEEVFERKSLKIAVISSFQWDIDWLVSKLDVPRTKLVLVMQAKDEATKAQYRQETSTWTNLRLCFPSMPGNVNCMHSKLMLLGYENHLRIAVPSANMRSHDWGESGILENTVFIIDLPRRLEGKSSEEDLGIFGRELIYFCKAMGLQQDIVDSLYSFDFSSASGYAFVHTIGGDHFGSEEGEAWRRTGFCGLGRAVKALGLDTGEDVGVDFIASSLGALNEDFLSTLYLACQGEDGKKELNWRTNVDNVLRHYEQKAKKLVPARSKAPDADLEGKAETLKSLRKYFRIYFPSHEVVMQARGGADAGGVIFLNANNYNGPRFPRSLLRICKSTRAGVLMHNKLLYVHRHGDGPGESHDWVYVGSGNCSESAWGKLTFNKTTRQIKMNCRNWECGVVIPMNRVSLASGVQPARPSSDQLGDFRGRVPVPIEYPGVAMEGNLPWHGDG